MYMCMYVLYKHPLQASDELGNEPFTVAPKGGSHLSLSDHIITIKLLSITITTITSITSTTIIIIITITIDRKRGSPTNRSRKSHLQVTCKSLESMCFSGSPIFGPPLRGTDTPNML